MPGSARSEAACSIGVSLVITPRSLVESGQRVKRWARQGNELNEAAHSGAALVREAFDRGIDGHCGARRGSTLERGRPLGDAKPAQERGLRDWAMHAGTHAFSSQPEGLKVHMRGQIDQPRRLQWIGVVMAADGLQRVPERAPRVAVVEHKRNAV